LFRSAARRSALLVAACAGAAYLLTLLPGAGHSGDTAELQFCGRVLGVAHPPGYPLYLALNHVFVRLVALGSLAWRANLLSAVCAVAALLVLQRLLAALRVDAGPAAVATLCFAFTPTFWRHALVAEVYALHALLFASALLLFLRWRRSGRDAHFYAACAAYALSFGNHLTMIVLLPALVLITLKTRPRAFLEPQRLCRVACLIALGMLQYLYLTWRAGAPSTPYLAADTSTLAATFAHATGAQFRSAMFAFSPAELLVERLPLFLAASWTELGPLLALAALGVARLGRCLENAVLGASFAANLAFAIGYDIPDLAPYFIPNHLLACIWLGNALQYLRDRVPGTRLALASLALPLALALVQRPAVEREKNARTAARAEMILDELGDDALVIADYHDYQFLLYYRLGEERGGPRFYPAHQVSAEEVARYLRAGVPIELPAIRARVPVGVRVYSTKLNHRPLLRRAGLTLTPFKWGVYRVTADGPQP
jgi:hypothetical protein